VGAPGERATRKLMMRLQHKAAEGSLPRGEREGA
jgi:hypothetical protein